MASAQRQSEPEAYADNAPLAMLFGDAARTKILSVLISEKGRDLSKSEIARQAGIARSTVYDHIEELQDLGAIEHTRDTQAGHSPRFTLAEESQLGQLLYKIEGATLKRLLELEQGDRV